MARVRVMYWKEIPVQVQAEDGSGQIAQQLEERFQQGVDSISMFDGSGGTDVYLDSWHWGEYFEMEGAAKEAAAQTAERFNKGFPRHFAERVRGLHESGKRDPRPGAVDHWIDGT